MNGDSQGNEYEWWSMIEENTLQNVATHLCVLKLPDDRDDQQQTTYPSRGATKVQLHRTQNNTTTEEPIAKERTSRNIHFSTVHKMNDW